MRLFVPSAQQPSQVVTAGVASLARGDVSRLLGSNPAQQDAAETPSASADFGNRLRLAGVAASKVPGGAGLAIISVDGNPPRVYRVGAVIDTTMVLHDVSSHTATVAMASSDGGIGPEVVLEMQPLAAAETGVLPSGAVPGAYGATSAMPGAGADGLDAVPVTEPPRAGRLLKGHRAR